MKFKVFLMLFSSWVLSMVQSCSNEEEPMRHGCSVEENVSMMHMVVTFEDKVYETDVKIVGDSVKYLNEEYADLYMSEIATLPQLATVMTVGEDGVTYVDYLVSQEEVERKYQLMNPKEEIVDLNIHASRSDTVIDLAYPDETATNIAYAELYDDRDFTDTMVKTYAMDKGCIYVPDLKSFGFNDKCSSIKVFNKMYQNARYQISYEGAPADYFDILGLNVFYGYELRPVFVGHEHNNYGGKKLYCIAPLTGSSEVHMDANLKTIGWNDKISSIEWTIVLASNIAKLLNGKDAGFQPHN